jgi:hypothetical protein
MAKDKAKKGKIVLEDLEVGKVKGGVVTDEGPTGGFEGIKGDFQYGKVQADGSVRNLGKIEPGGFGRGLKH